MLLLAVLVTILLVLIVAVFSAIAVAKGSRPDYDQDI